MSVKAPNLGFLASVLVAEGVNRRYVRHLAENPEAATPFGAILEAQSEFEENGLDSFRKAVGTSRFDLPEDEHSDLKVHVRRVFSVLLQKPGREDAEGEEVFTTTKAPKVSVRPPWSLSRVNGFYYPTQERTFFSSVPIQVSLQGRPCCVDVQLQEEVFEPILLAERFGLAHHPKSNVQGIQHLIQRWIRSYFYLAYSRTIKALLVDLCREVNILFFGDDALEESGYPEKQRLVEEALFLDYLDNYFFSLAKGSGQLGLASGARAHKIMSMGFLYLLRFAGFAEILHVVGLDADKVAVLRPEAEKLLEKPGAGLVHFKRPIDYNHLLARSFGAITDIEGLNFIFDGGILPRVRSGRTMLVRGGPGSGKTGLALQKLAGVAARGGFAAYISLDESRESLFERLVTFDLIDPDRFTVGNFELDGFGLDAPARDSDPGKGLFLLCGLALQAPGDESQAQGGKPGKQPQEEAQSPSVSMRSVINALDHFAGSRWKWRSLAVDSINSLQFGRGGTRASLSDSTKERRRLATLIDLIEAKKFLGILISEAGEDSFRSIEYLVDTSLALGQDRAGLVRTIEIKKCRAQSFHPGLHPFRMISGKGVKVYPSLAAIRASLRRGRKGALDQNVGLEFPKSVKFQSLPEPRSRPLLFTRSVCVISGPAASGKSELALEMALSKAVNEKESLPGPGILVLSFKTPSSRFFQYLEFAGLLSKWRKSSLAIHRWFSPGVTITADQIVGEVWGRVRAARRSGVPISRLIVDDVESAEVVLPYLAQSPLFWPTLLDLLSSLGLTSFFVSGPVDEGSRPLAVLQAGSDYILQTRTKDASKDALKDASKDDPAHPICTKWPGRFSGLRTSSK